MVLSSICNVSYAETILDGAIHKLYDLAKKSSPILDYVPDEKKIEKYCDANLSQLIGITSSAIAGAAATGLSQSTVIAQPSLALVAGESNLMLVSGTRITTITTPVIGSTLATTATVATLAYGSGRAVCAVSSWLSSTHVTNQDLPLVMLIRDRHPNFGETLHDLFEAGAARFEETSEIIPAGTPILSLGHIDLNSEAYYPDHDGRGLIQLGRFFDHVYQSKIPEKERGFVVVPATSLNTIYKEKYTHQLIEDLEFEHAGQIYRAPRGSVIRLIKKKKNGWVKMEFADGFNSWLMGTKGLIELNNEELTIYTGK